jgi:hypothetical protein
MITAALLIAPWAVRNWQLTGRLIPVHLLAGTNMRIGDVIVENYRRAPLSFDKLWQIGETETSAFEGRHVPDNIPRANREVIKDSLYTRTSIARYLHQPGFLLRKMALNSVLFWFLGESASKTLLITFLNLPLLVLVVASTKRNMQHISNRHTCGLHLTLVLLFFASYLPFAACARYAVAVIPIMLAYAASAFSPGPGCGAEGDAQRQSVEERVRR